MKKIPAIILVSLFSLSVPGLAHAGDGGKSAKPAGKDTPKQGTVQNEKGKADQNKGGKKDQKDDKAWNTRDY